MGGVAFPHYSPLDAHNRAKLDPETIHRRTIDEGMLYCGTINGRAIHPGMIEIEGR